MIKLKYSYKLLVLILIFFRSLVSFAQEQISGLIVDASNDNPMSYVNIAVVGSTYGTVSNQNGEFTINLSGINPDDTIAFHYLGYQTIKKRIHDLTDGIIIALKEESVNIEEIIILANPITPEELIKKALENRTKNYPVIPQKREVFKRYNSASYIDKFELKLVKSDIPEIDDNLIKEMIDSMPRYVRQYQDNLYTLYSIPDDSLKELKKIEALKRVILNERNGGDLEQIEQTVTSILEKKTGDKTFWKLKTGIISLKVDNNESPEPDSSTVVIDEKKLDSLSKLNAKNLYSLVKSDYEQWDLDFIQKTGRYRYKIEGLVTIMDERAYAIGFKAKLRGDYEGKIYISGDSFAILRIEYSIKSQKKTGGFKLLGVNYGETDDSGLILYAKDELGYYLKYSMRNDATAYGINRPFEFIKKRKRPGFNKKENGIKLDINITGHEETTNETLVVYRQSLSTDNFRNISEKGVKPEYIKSYSDSIWKGYSIIEPTKQMKEYKAKIQ